MINRSKFPRANESRLVRFVRDDRDRFAPWVLVGSLDDRELAARGALLAGPELDREALREDGLDDALVAILEDESLTAAERDKGAEDLLARCPRSRFLPPIDLDVAPGHTRAEALEWARKLEPELVREGMSSPIWHRTGGTVGVHGDLFAPPGFQHPDLLEIARILVVRAATRIGLPLISNHRATANRPAVVLDDSLFRRNPERRGVVWRLSGGLKPGGGIKTPIDLDDVEIAYPDAVAVDARFEAFETSSVLVERQRALEGRGRGAARPKREVAPCVLPPGTRFLANFSSQFAAVVPAGARHEPRLAAAGWLMGTLGVADEVVEASFVTSGSSSDDARDCVSSTRRRLSTGSACAGLPKLQDVLGGRACAQLREALVADGVAKARKTWWTNPERRTLMNAFRAVPRAHKGRLALRDGARCGTFALPFECEDHGPQGVRLNVEERELTCPHCREARWVARLEILRETWVKSHYTVLRVNAHEGENLVREVVAARRAGKGVLFRGWRWFLGHDHVLFVTEAYDAKGIDFNAKFGGDSRSHEGNDGVTRGYVRAYEHGVRPGDAQRLTRDETFEAIGRTWRSPGVAFQGLVEVEDHAAIVSAPWLLARGACRTRADTDGELKFPWPTAKAIRERAKARAVELRGGIDPTQCCEPVEFDLEYGQPTSFCCKPYHVYVDHLPTGVRLREEPFVGVFPRKHELETLLEAVDPEALREGYELQLALGRQRR